MVDIINSRLTIEHQLSSPNVSSIMSLSDSDVSAVHSRSSSSSNKPIDIQNPILQSGHDSTVKASSKYNHENSVDDLKRAHQIEMETSNATVYSYKIWITEDCSITLEDCSFC